MPRWRLDIAYDGSRYNGWQRQPHAPTIQGAIEAVIHQITQRTDAELTGAGRTDTGVHARGQVAHVDLDLTETPKRFTHRLNAMLPVDIRIRKMTPVEEGFHARYSALSRTYRYELGFEADPLRPLRWIVPADVDIEAMRQAAEELLGTHDFRNYATQSDDKENTLCTVIGVAFEPTNDGWVFEITADRFLRSMVRRIMAMLVGKGVKPGSAWKVPLVAPAHALVLHRVDYNKKGD
jgi:tRNA pseudouridine38-40 synthase